jgi:hypothetical protein
MAAREIRLELLLGSPVVDASGRVVGHVEEVVAKRHGKEYVVQEILTGLGGYLGRVAASASDLPLLRRLPGIRRLRPQRIPWRSLDLSDPSKPRLIE